MLDLGLVVRLDRLVVPNDFLDHEGQKLLGEVGVELGLDRELAEPGDLTGFPVRIGRGIPFRALSSPTRCVQRKRSARRWISAASKLSMLSRRRASSGSTACAASTLISSSPA
nr:hypothetical protein [Methylobacterium tardum]